MPVQELDLDFTGGVDEKTQSQLVEPGATLVCTNLRQLKNASLQKRPGMTKLSASVNLSGSAIPTQKRLIAYHDEICSTDNLNLYSRVASMGRWKKAPGYVPQFDTKIRSVAPLQYILDNHHVISVNGYLVLVYSTSTTNIAPFNHAIYATVLDGTSGETILPPVSIVGATVGANVPQVAVASAGNVVVACWGIIGSSNLAAVTLDTTSAATLAAGWQLSGNIVTDMMVAAPRFDMCSLGSTFVLAYANVRADGAATHQITVTSFDSVLSVQATQTGIDTGGGAGIMSAVAVSGTTANGLFVAYSMDTGLALECTALNPTSLTITGTRAALTGAIAACYRVTVLSTGVGSGVAFCDVDNGIGVARRFDVVTGAVVPYDSAEHTYYNVNLESKLFLANGRAYVAMRPTAIADDAQLLVIDATATMADVFTSGTNASYLRVAANPNPRLSYQTSIQNRIPPTVAVLSSTKAILTSSTKQNAIGSSMDLITMDWAATNLCQPAILGDLVALAGSPPSFYDGVRTSEIGFFQSPRIVSRSFSGIVGPGPGEVKYVCVYEQMDNNGQWHQSSPGRPFSVTTGGAGEGVFLVVTTLTASNRAEYGTPVSTPQYVRIVPYRTQVGGNEYYRVPGCEVTNEPNVPTITLPLDTHLDTALGAPLYTQPGTANVSQFKASPPPLTCLIAHGDRLVGCTGKTVWFSGQYVQGEAPWFADLFQFNVGTSGDITALASLDGALIVFKRDQIAFVDGSGPPDNGAGGDYSPPQFIAADVGCIEPRSVVVTPAGVMFQSLRGIEMLSRGRSLATYFGSHVEATLAANPIITSAVLDEQKSVVVFTCVPYEGATNSGKEIVWDYVHNIWVQEDLDGGALNIQSSIMWGRNVSTVPVRTVLQAGSSTVLQASTSDFTDFGNYVGTDLVLPWVKMSGLQGYGRTCGVGILFESKTPCDILVTIRLDYRSDIVQTRLFTADEIADIGDPKELWVTFKTQKCESFQIEMQDMTPTGGPAVGTGQGPVYVGKLRVEYQPKSGTNRTSRLKGA